MSKRAKSGGLAAALLFVAGLTGIGEPGRSEPLQTQISPPQHESTVVNIEVPVRVLKKGTFVNGLTLADFEVFENGVRQNIEAVYLIKDKQVLREEKTAGAALQPPRSARNYVLYLDLKEYLPKVGDALDYFFDDVLSP